MTEPTERIIPLATGGIVRSRRGLTRAQIDRLRQAIDPTFVDRKQGKLAYMAQHEVRAELTRIFGYGNWDMQTESMEFLWEYDVVPGHPDYPMVNGKPKADAKPVYYRACYKASVRLNIRDYWGNHVATFIGMHAEANSILPDRGEAHAMAITSVESYAMRRAAINLGDRFGLGLYDAGKTDPLVRNSLQFTDPDSPWFKEPTAEEVAARQARLQGAVNS